MAGVRNARSHTFISRVGKIGSCLQVTLAILLPSLLSKPLTMLQLTQPKLEMIESAFLCTAERALAELVLLSH